MGLPFKGRNVHPLDGKLRLLVFGPNLVNDKHQTTLPVSRHTHLGWVPDATHPKFRVWDQEGTRMIWRIEGQNVVCIQGREFLAPDPYATEAAPK